MAVNQKTHVLKIKMCCIENISHGFGGPPAFGSSEQTHKLFESHVNIGLCPEDPHTEKKVIVLGSGGFYEKSKGYFSFGSNESSSRTFGNPHFYLTFNTFDGKKQVHRVNDVNEIESVVLEYKVDCIASELNTRVKKHKDEIDALKMERQMLCELIDAANLTNDPICHTIREKCNRFFDLKNIKEMNDEFDFINKQIQIGREEICRLEDQLKNKESEKYESVIVTIPYGTIVNIKTFDNIKTFGNTIQTKNYDCFWKHVNPEDHEINMKKNGYMVEIDDEVIKKKQKTDDNDLSGFV